VTSLWFSVVKKEIQPQRTTKKSQRTTKGKRVYNDQSQLAEKNVKRRMRKNYKQEHA